MVTATSDYLKPISFLVVDDRAYMRRVIKGILETLGCKRIDEAQHGGEALSVPHVRRMLAERRPGACAPMVAGLPGAH